METQSRAKSWVFWVGLFDAVLVGITGIAITVGWLSPETGGAIITASAGILGYCNSNNPSLKGI
jgi:hypothetical protein